MPHTFHFNLGAALAATLSIPALAQGSFAVPSATMQGASAPVKPSQNAPISLAVLLQSGAARGAVANGAAGSGAAVDGRPEDEAGISSSLPESPGTLVAAASESRDDFAGMGPDDVGLPEETNPFSPRQSGTVAPLAMAPKYSRTVKFGQSALPLNAGDKMILSLRTKLSAMGTFSTFYSAGWGHLTDNRPHFGTDKAGFGERLGGSAARQMANSLFTYGVYASLFHDDPRYYVLGRSSSIKKRAIYSATRLVITKKDNGRTGINWPQLAGVVSSQALANVYYPSRDQDVGKTVNSVISSYGTTILQNELREFIGDAIALIRHKK